MKDNNKPKKTGKFFGINIVAVDENGKELDTSAAISPQEDINVLSAKSLPAESSIQMKMMIPDESDLNLIKTTGTIKWFKEVKGKNKKYFVMGVHFRDMQKTDRNKLISLWKKYS